MGLHIFMTQTMLILLFDQITKINNEEEGGAFGNLWIGSQIRFEQGEGTYVHLFSACISYSPIAACRKTQSVHNFFKSCAYTVLFPYIWILILRINSISQVLSQHLNFSFEQPVHCSQKSLLKDLALSIRICSISSDYLNLAKLSFE